MIRGMHVAVSIHFKASTASTVRSVLSRLAARSKACAVRSRTEGSLLLRTNPQRAARHGKVYSKVLPWCARLGCATQRLQWWEEKQLEVAKPIARRSDKRCEIGERQSSSKQTRPGSVACSTSNHCSKIIFSRRPQLRGIGGPRANMEDGVLYCERNRNINPLSLH
jgi:hypothetical protein